GLWPHALKLAADLHRQATHAGEVEAVRNAGVFMALLARDFLVLTIQVAGVLHPDLDLLGDRGIGHRRAERWHRDQTRIGHFRPLEQVARAGLAAQLDPKTGVDLTPQRIVGRGPDRTQPGVLGLDRLALGGEPGPARITDQT